MITTALAFLGTIPRWAYSILAFVVWTGLVITWADSQYAQRIAQQQAAFEVRVAQANEAEAKLRSIHDAVLRERDGAIKELTDATSPNQCLNADDAQRLRDFLGDLGSEAAQ